MSILVTETINNALIICYLLIIIPKCDKTLITILYIVYQTIKRQATLSNILTENESKRASC